MAAAVVSSAIKFAEGGAFALYRTIHNNAQTIARFSLKLACPNLSSCWRWRRRATKTKTSPKFAFAAALPLLRAGHDRERKRVAAMQ